MKLIASDYDGTIRDDKDGLLLDIAAIKKWREHGNVFAIISGRNAPQIRDIAEKNQIPADFVLGDSGNTCYKDGRLEYSFVLNDHSVLTQLVSVLYECNAVYICIDRPLEATVVYYRKENAEVTTDLLDSLDAFDSFSQISAYFRGKNESHIAEKVISERMNGKVSPFPNGDCIDVVPFGRSKAHCVGVLAEHLNISGNDIFTIGDNYNDIPMIRSYGGFCVRNAPDDVKKYAKCGIVGSVAKMIDILLGE